jgi:hypothetical protein
LKKSASKHALVGLFGDSTPSKKKTMWFVFADDDCKRVGEGDDSLNLAVKAVRSLASDGVPAGNSRHDRGVRKWMLELAVEFTRAREYRKSLTPKQRAKADAALNKLVAGLDALASGRPVVASSRSTRRKP